MRTSTRSFRSFNVRSPSGAVVPAVARFSAGLVADCRGTYRQVSDDEVIAAALRIVSHRLVRGSALAHPRATWAYLALRFAGLEHEVFSCIYLDNRHRMIACEELFRGTIDGASVHPREVGGEASADS